ncbi:UNVERIFIED_CONTAM: hypothetical protein GTU68_008976 [Idotea baltica]|nr:hypothetical protein [Idotea baltica]
MCGIIAYTGKQSVLPILLGGLKRLEYRGYDSTGISILSRRKIKTVKAAGKLNMLESKINGSIAGQCGIGHTRWATHGAPTDNNAHPHTDPSNRFAIVHNGIIENVDALKKLLDKDTIFRSQTDSEVIAHLLAQQPGDSLSAVREVLSLIVGTYGLAVIDQQHPDTIVVARNGSPVILGIGDNQMLAASDMSALSRHTDQVVHLDDGEIAKLTPLGFEVIRMDSSIATKEAITLNNQNANYDRGGHPHYLYKEIVDQADTVQQTLSGRLDDRFSTAHLGGLNLDARDLIGVKRITILGCGSALYAGMAGANMIESLARLPVSAEPAAEFRYRNPVIEQDTLYIVVSQSGETFDTLAALREVRRKGGFVLGIVNSVGSTIAREVDGGIYMHAGPEVSVASTKAYTSMLIAFALLALLLGRSRDVSPQQGSRLINDLKQLPANINSVLALEPAIATLANKYKNAKSAFFIGRTNGYPIALEGAQKLKEISYIHAEAYPASELKHGPLALVTNKTPCVVVLPNDDLLPKSISSMEEIKARGGPVIALTGAAQTDTDRIDKLADDVIRVPDAEALTLPAVMGVALQLFAYHSALSLGRDVDQPRNLAKSVTVE